MNLDEAKKKLAVISKSTGTKHPKVLISELCHVVQFLLNEIDRIQIPSVTVLPTTDDSDTMVNPPQKSWDIPNDGTGRPDVFGNAGDE